MFPQRWRGAEFLLLNPSESHCCEWQRAKADLQLPTYDHGTKPLS